MKVVRNLLVQLCKSLIGGFAGVPRNGLLNFLRDTFTHFVHYAEIVSAPPPILPSSFAIPAQRLEHNPAERRNRSRTSRRDRSAAAAADPC